jgi:hypothetical protein
VQELAQHSEDHLLLAVMKKEKCSRKKKSIKSGGDLSPR